MFRSCFVAANLVTSLEFNPIRCATMLCHFGQLRNGSLANHFIHFSSTATNSATGEYIVPENKGQIDEPASTNEEKTRNKPSIAPKVCLKVAQ